MTLRVGIDLGGTAAKLAVVNENKKILADASVPSEGFPSPSRLVERISSTLIRMLQGRSVGAIGVGVAGDIDFVKGRVRVSPNLGWKNVPLRTLFEKKLKRPVTVDNDANAAAWGVYQTQVPRTVKHVIVVTLGTGVGGGLIIDGRLHRGATGSAGEIGHMILEKAGRRCNCGLNGCLETFLGGIHMVSAVRERLDKGERSRLQAVVRDGSLELTPKIIADAALKGDKLALSVWEQSGRTLGRALGDLIYVLNPGLIFLTGGVSQAGRLILDPLNKELAKRPFRTPVAAMKIRVAKDPTHMGVLGAAFL